MLETNFCSGLRLRTIQPNHNRREMVRTNDCTAQRMEERTGKTPLGRGPSMVPYPQQKPHSNHRRGIGFTSPIQIRRK